MPLLLLAILLLRMAATLPGVETPHAHGGLTHTHASGGFAHGHETAPASGETVYPVRIAVRQRPADTELFHAHTTDHTHAADETAPQRHDDAPPSGAPDPDRRKTPESYFCAASALVLASDSPALTIAPIPPLGVIVERTQVTQRAVWRTKSTRGPPPNLPVEIAFT